MPTAPAPPAVVPVIELRQYTLHPGQRETLIELFDHELLEPQESCGMRVVGQFRDLDDPDQFVWIRSFPDMDSRRLALSAFYDGPVWARHRDAANATMISSDDVLLLRPTAAHDFPRPSARSGTEDTTSGAPALFHASLYPLAEAPSPPVLNYFTDVVEPVLTAAGGSAVAELQTAPYENTFPRLPVRAGEHVIVRFTRFAGADSDNDHRHRLDASPEWQSVQSRVHDLLVGPARHLWLQPTTRSALR